MSQQGNFYWNELLTTDPEACKKFYGEVVGWKSREMDMGNGAKYTIVKVGDKDAGGIMKMDGPQFEGVPPHWMTYIAVDDVDAALKRTTANGGEVRVPAFDVPGVGRIGVIADPTGAMVSLMTPASS